MRSAEAMQDLQMDQTEQTKDRNPLVNPLVPDEGNHVSLEEYWEKSNLESGSFFCSLSISTRMTSRN